jgi:hypothetical protein
MEFKKQSAFHTEPEVAEHLEGVRKHALDAKERPHDKEKAAVEVDVARDLIRAASALVREPEVLDLLRRAEEELDA